MLPDDDFRNKKIKEVRNDNGQTEGANPVFWKGVEGGKRGIQKTVKY